MQLSDALALIHSSRKAILFLGAGFANESANLTGRPTPSSSQLSKRILKKLALEADTDVPLSFAVDQLREAEPPDEAFGFLLRELTVSKPTPTQLKILALPWRRIYTTNIDNIGASFSNRPYLDAAVDSRPSNPGDFIYLHGCLANCQPQNYYPRVKMGEQLYIAGTHSNSPWVNHSGVMAFSNSVIGEFIFKNFIDKEATIGAVVRFANFIDGHYAQRQWQWIVRRFLRFWNLSRILDSRKLPEQVFDRASYIPSIAADPLFWVQYSIAKMENGEYLPARRFVDTAYGKARELGDHFDTYQIDTHAARLTVRNLTDNGLYDGFANELIRAVNTLRDVAKRRPNDTYHVSTVVTLLLTSKIPFAYEMSERDFGLFRNALIEIGNKIDEGMKGTDFSFAPERQASDLIAGLR